MAAQTMSALTTRFSSALRSLAIVALALVLSFGLTACSGAKAKAPTLSADDIAVIERQAEGFLAARDRLPELATLVINEETSAYPATTREVTLPPNLNKLYIRASAVGEANGGDASDGDLTISIIG
jgi:hypothetical protein